MDVHGHRENQKPLVVATADTKGEMVRLPSDASGYSFCDMGKDYEFFTPGVIAVASEFDRDIVGQYVQYQAPALHDTPLVIDYPGEPFFAGLGRQDYFGETVDWDRRLYAVPRKRWHHVREWILGVAFVVPASRTYNRLMVYELRVLDPILVKRGGVLPGPPAFPVNVFAVSNNRQFSLVLPDGDNPPRLTRQAPRPDTVQEAAAAMRTGAPDPHGLYKHRKRRRR